jgi:cobalt/nickel transport system permease protein
VLPEISNSDNTFLHRLDPRVRLLSALIFSIWIVLQHQIFTLCIGLCIATWLYTRAHLPHTLLFTKLISLNLFLGLLGVFLPFTTPSEVWLAFLGFNLSQQGLWLFCQLTLKSNTLLLSMTAFLNSMDLITLGYALEQLYVPSKLTRLLLFTSRYLTLLQNNYVQLFRAMRARGFRLKTNLHTYRSIAYLLGMLLIRSVLRAQKIEAAMRCRGYQGDFHRLQTPSLKSHDKWFMGIFYTTLLLLSGAL